MKGEQENTNHNHDTPPERVAWLIAGYLRQTLSEEEHDELDEWMTASDDNQRLFEELTDPKTIEEGIATMKGTHEEAMLKKVKAELLFTRTKEHARSGNKLSLLRMGIAASVLILAGTIVYFVMYKKNHTKEIAQATTGDIAAGGNKAILQLADGRTINLGEAKNGLLDSTNGTEVLKAADGQLSYESHNDEGKGEHILTTPAGGQYTVTLPDGTRVWLNASSSLTYPVVFGQERIVELSGEGYFEASSQPSPGGEGAEKIPFIVKLKDGAQVEVVGTHFNINAYDDETVIETTLLEGKVVLRQVEGDNRYSTKELKPGDQGKIGANGELSVESGVDTGAVIAWKNGKFQFKDARIETIMKQVARWYDAEIVYEAKVDYHFNATTIYRTEPLSKLLAVLEATDRVHFKIEGRKVMVRP